MLSPLSIAPMVDWTNTHFRVFMRYLLPKALLYTEMHTVPAIKHNPSRTLKFSACEHPLALQVGGIEEEGLVYCAKFAEELGFTEINLNVGCPSDKVLSGNFGACLMAKPKEVAKLITAMKSSVSIPVTVKTRIGIDYQDSYEFFASFVHSLADAGCDKFIIHARKAWLSGLSSKQNRTIPPVNYDFVYKIKQELASIPVIINGNIESIEDIKTHLKYTDGVMLGRLACSNPFALTNIHKLFFPEALIKSRSQIVKEYATYIDEQVEIGVPIAILIKPLFNFAHGLLNASNWKKQLMLFQQTKQREYLTKAIDFFNNDFI